MHKFFEFFIERFVWFWRPVFSLYQVLNDLISEGERDE
jgi:hypothetical protein